MKIESIQRNIESNQNLQNNFESIQNNLNRFKFIFYEPNTRELGNTPGLDQEK